MERGDVMVRREVWRDEPWSALPVTVVEDDEDLLVVHLAVGTRIGFAESHPLGVHPWSTNECWQGHDVVMLHRRDDPYSVWFFGSLGTYVNLQDPIRRTAIGFDTFDHELDIVISPCRAWSFKDEDRLQLAVETGRFTPAEVTSISQTGQALGDMLDRRTPWWDDSWSSWTPPADWPIPVLPQHWALRGDWQRRS